MSSRVDQKVVKSSVWFNQPHKEMGPTCIVVKRGPIYIGGRKSHRVVRLVNKPHKKKCATQAETGSETRRSNESSATPREGKRDLLIHVKSPPTRVKETY